MLYSLDSETISMTDLFSYLTSCYEIGQQRVMYLIYGQHKLYTIVKGHYETQDYLELIHAYGKQL